MTWSVDREIVDANILLHAVDADSTFHRAANEWLENVLNGPHRVGFPWASITAFQRIATHPRASAQPMTPAEAWSYVSDWLGADQSWIPHPGERHAEIFSQLVLDGELRGNLVTDAHLAALALEHGVGVCSVDSDFARFPKLAWHNPATA